MAPTQERFRRLQVYLTIFDHLSKASVHGCPVAWRVCINLRPNPTRFSKADLLSFISVDGRVITPIDESAVRQAAEEIRAVGLTNIAIIGTYSPIDSVFHQEEHVRDILRSVLGTTVNITLSHEVAGIGFIERENATILNATILPFAKKTIKQFQQSLRGLRLSASL